MKPLASIIIPAYNAAPTVEEAVDSAFAQTYSNCEVIVVDDGSTDRTAELLEKYRSHPNFISIRQENKGLSGARNTGIKAARGEYIFLLDSDDRFLPEKVERQVAILEANPEFDVCYSDLIHFTDETPRRYFHHRHTYPHGDVLPTLLHKQVINPLTLAIRKRVFDRLGYFDEELRRSEDWDMWLRWAKAGIKFYFLPEILAEYRIRLEGNLSSLSSEPQMKEKNLEIFQRFDGRLTESERVEYDMPGILTALEKKVMIAHWLVGDRVKALEYARKFPGWAILIRIVPSVIASRFLALIRSLKHRLLLERVTR